MTAKFVFGMSDYTVIVDVGTGGFSLMLGILHLCGHVHVFPGIDWCTMAGVLTILQGCNYCWNFTDQSTLSLWLFSLLAV